MTTPEDTIFAPSSGTQRSGVCVIRVSGYGCNELMDLALGGQCVPRQASLRALRVPSSKMLIDRCLALFFPGPASFTGEDVVELHVHGGTAVIDASLNLLGELPGFRLAEPGEFARRAFDNGKLDLTEVEGLADLINAQTEAQRRLAILDAAGHTRAKYEDWRSQLLRCLAYVEADVDFVDEDDIPDDLNVEVVSGLRQLARTLQVHVADPNGGEILRNGYRVAIAGVPNVGKSSLLNCLARRDAAIVTDVAGTTRDIVEVMVDLAGYPIVFCDTAGLRDTADKVESIGVERATSAVESADLVLWVCDERGQWPELVDRVIDSYAVWIRNKSDVASLKSGGVGPDGPLIQISAQTGAGIVELLSIIEQRAADRFKALGDDLVVRHRHAECVRVCLDHIQTALKQIDDGFIEAELLAEELRLAGRALGRLGGRIGVEDVLGQIFGEFCIGK